MDNIASFVKKAGVPKFKALHAADGKVFFSITDSIEHCHPDEAKQISKDLNSQLVNRMKKVDVLKGKPEFDVIMKAFGSRIVFEVYAVLRVKDFDLANQMVLKFNKA